MTAHAQLSASGSSRWLNCPGSVHAESIYPPDGEGSEFAIEGSMAHELADLCLKKNRDAESYIGKKVYKRIVEKEMAEYVQEYVDYVRSFENRFTTLYAEERVSFEHIVPGGFGTLDSAVVDSENKICHIFDLKYGKGVKVDAFENTQAQLYATGMEHDLSFLHDIETFRLHIVQPRIFHFSSWDISKEDLIFFGKYVTERAQLALSPGAQRIPGKKQCQWCRAKGDCKALLDFTTATITAEFDDLNSIDVETLSIEEKKSIMDNKSLIQLFLNAVEASVFDQLGAGKPFEGYKLVEGRSIRKWNNLALEALIKKLGDEAYTKKIIGITEAEKRLGRDFTKELTDKPKGKTILAPSDDKRQELDIVSTEELFDEL